MCKDEVLQFTSDTVGCFDLSFLLLFSCINWRGSKGEEMGRESGKRERKRESGEGEIGGGDDEWRT